MARPGVITKSARSGRPRPEAVRGPVADLERHLPAEWWRELFGVLYLRTDGDVVENPASTRADVDALVHVAGLKPEHRILDLCCGQGRHALELSGRGFDLVTGIDQSAYLLGLARRRARRAGLPVRFKRGDARVLTEPDAAFDRIAVMGNSFGYFESSTEDATFLRGALRCLAPGGVLTLDITDGDWMRRNFAAHSWEWIGPRQLVCRQRALAREDHRLISREIVIDIKKGIIADQFYAERLYSRTGIAELLEQVGFSNVQWHDAPDSISDRGQDLGMLAHRLLVTAVAPTNGQVRRLHPTVRDVVVLLGDPRQPDAVKRDGQFNDEDREAVVNLRAALAKLAGYRFTFIDDHRNLAARLGQHPGALVLNLCDEGLNNRPDHELHVPAMLESLGMDYTGAGPRALALCFDKSATSGIAAAMGVPVPREVFVAPQGPLPSFAGVLPGFIKPNCADGSVGIGPDGIVATAAAAAAVLAQRRAALPGHAWLVQEYLDGTEYTVSILGNPGHDLRALPVAEVDFSGLPKGTPNIRSYSSKWDINDTPYHVVGPKLPTALTRHEGERMQAQSLLLFERLGCRDYARFDFRRGRDGVIRFLEANPNPGWTWDCTLIVTAGFMGYDYPAVLDQILRAAIARAGTAKS